VRDSISGTSCGYCKHFHDPIEYDDKHRVCFGGNEVTALDEGCDGFDKQKFHKFCPQNEFGVHSIQCEYLRDLRYANCLDCPVFANTPPTVRTPRDKTLFEFIDCLKDHFPGVKTTRIHCTFNIKGGFKRCQGCKVLETKPKVTRQKRG